MHERADTAREILARADDFLQQTCLKYAAPATLCCGGYDDHPWGSRPAPDKSRVRTEQVPARVHQSGVTAAAVTRPPCGSYFSSTLAPAPSSCSLALSASSLDTFSRTGLGADSTSSFASLSPRLVRVRTSLMTLIFSLPASARTTSNSSCSSAASAAGAPAAAARAALGRGARLAAVRHGTRQE